MVVVTQHFSPGKFRLRTYNFASKDPFFNLKGVQLEQNINQLPGNKSKIGVLAKENANGCHSNKI